jgi:hypothetical protein
MTTPPSTRQAVTQLLGDWSGGDVGALEKLFPLVQPELHRLAHHYMSRERAGHTLQTTAILNEAYLRLVDNTKPVWQGRSHFIAAAAQLMRRCVSTADSRGRTIFVADAHREDGKRFVVHADEKVSAFVELESAIRARPAVGWSTWLAAFDDNSFLAMKSPRFCRSQLVQKGVD